MLPRSASESQCSHRHSPGHVKRSTWPPQHLGARTVAQIQLVSPLWQNLYPWFSGQTPLSAQRCPCSSAVPGLLALLPATASAEGSHHIFNWSDFACNFAFFLAHYWRRLCNTAQSRMPFHIFGIQFPVCLCVTDLSLHLMLIWTWQVI